MVSCIATGNPGEHWEDDRGEKAAEEVVPLALGALALEGSEPQFGGRIVAKQRAVADVLAQGVEGFVAGRPHDGDLRGAVQKRLGGKAGAQAVAGVAGRIEVRLLDIAAQLDRITTAEE